MKGFTAFHFNPGTSAKILTGAGIFITISGLIVLSGWITGNPGLQNLFLGSTPVKPNTAFCFISIGISVILFQTKVRSAKFIIRSLSLILIIISVLTLAEYLFNVNLGIDSLVCGKQATTNIARMSIYSAFSVALLGIVLFRSANISGKKGSIFRYLIAISFSVGIFNAVVLLMGLRFPGEYSDLNPPALATSLLLIFSSLVLYANKLVLNLDSYSESQNLSLGLTIITLLFLQLGIHVLEWLRFEDKTVIALEKTETLQKLVNLTQYDILQMQNSLRGYLITSDSEIKDKTNKVISDLQERIELINILSADQIGFRQMFDTARKYINQRIKFTGKVIETFNTEGSGAATRYIGRGYGSMVMDSISSQMDRLSIKLDKKEADQITENKIITRTLIYQVVIALILILVIIAMVLILILGFVRKQKRSYAEIRKMNNRIRLALDSSNAGTLEWDMVNNQFYWTEEFKRLCGIDPSLKPGLETWANSIHPDDRERTWNIFADSIKQKKDLQTEYRVIMPDKSIRWIRTAATVECTGEVPVRMLGICYDITDLKEKEVKIERIAESLKLAEKASYSGSYDWDLKTDTTFWSDSFYELMGIEKSVMPSFDAWQVAVHPDDIENVKKNILDSIKERRSIFQEYRVVLPNNEIRWIRSIGQTYCEGSTPVRHAGMCRDVTETKKIEEELIHAKQVAETANNAKSEFLLNISHEFRTPLNAIIGYAELLETAKAEEIPGYTASVKSSGRKLMAMVNDILDFIRSEKDELEFEQDVVSSCDLVRDIQLIYTDRCSEKGLKFTSTLIDVPEFLSLDAGRYCQAVSSLLDNAVKYTDKGEVGLKLYSVRNRDNADLIDLITEVRDTGKGMSEEFQKNLFQVFTQEDKKTVLSGIGIGLALTRRIVLKMKGSIKVTSQPGMGTTFIVILPGLSSHGSSMSDSSKTEIKKEENVEIKSSEIIDPEGLVNTLEGSLRETNKLLQTRQPLGEVKKFGQALVDIGLLHNARAITEYGRNLVTAAENFDIDGMLKLINSYERMIESLKK